MILLLWFILTETHSVAFGQSGQLLSAQKLENPPVLYQFQQTEVAH